MVVALGVSVSSSDFNEIALKRDRGRSERLFRAAVTAFASLTRPSRNEITQLEDLTLPLYDGVSPDARRFVAAVLSETQYPPTALVRRLAGERIDIAAPLLLRSRALTDVDLIGLIGRHGTQHAGVIARRENLHPVIAQLCTALLRSDRCEPEPAATEQPVSGLAAMTPASAYATTDHDPAPVSRSGQASEEIRAKLRAMMRPATETQMRSAAPTTLTPSMDANSEIRGFMSRSRERTTAASSLRPDPYTKLRDSALTGVKAFFQTALADVLGIGFAQARSIVLDTDPADLTAVLKSIDLTAEQAYVIAAALHPSRFGHAEAIRIFLERYRLLHHQAAADRVRGWKAAALATLPRPVLQAEALPVNAANSPGRPTPFGKLKVS